MSVTSIFESFFTDCAVAMLEMQSASAQGREVSGELTDFLADARNLDEAVSHLGEQVRARSKDKLTVRAVDRSRLDPAVARVTFGVFIEVALVEAVEANVAGAQASALYHLSHEGLARVYPDMIRPK